MRLADYFDAVAQLRPDNLAFVDGATRMTYGEAQKYVHAVAHGLTRARGGRGHACGNLCAERLSGQSSASGYQPG